MARAPLRRNCGHALMGSVPSQAPWHDGIVSRACGEGKGVAPEKIGERSANGKLTGIMITAESFPDCGDTLHVMAGLVPRLSGSILMDKVHDVDSSAF
jgi:hypothetical protein